MKRKAWEQCRKLPANMLREKEKLAQRLVTLALRKSAHAISKRKHFPRLKRRCGAAHRKPNSLLSQELAIARKLAGARALISLFFICEAVKKNTKRCDNSCACSLHRNRTTAATIAAAELEAEEKASAEKKSLLYATPATSFIYRT